MIGGSPPFPASAADSLEAGTSEPMLHSQADRRFGHTGARRCRARLADARKP